MAFIAPPGMSAHAMIPAAEASSVDCDHAPPPPDPCPSEGTAKHAASECCPLMSGSVAVLPSPAGIETAGPRSTSGRAPASGRSLAGLDLFTKDPPPPRV